MAPLCFWLTLCTDSIGSRSSEERGQAEKCMDAHLECKESPERVHHPSKLRLVSERSLGDGAWCPETFCCTTPPSMLVPTFEACLSLSRASQVELVLKNPRANVGATKDVGWTPGSGRSPGGGHGNPLQYPCLENPTDGGAWRAAIHRVT